MYASDIAIKAKKYDECYYYLDKIKNKHNWTISANFVRASCDAHLGNNKSAVSNLNNAIIQYCTYENQFKTSEFITQKPTDKSFEEAPAAMAINDLITSLNSIGIEPFLVSGTLLGYARSGTVLSHDKDIDIGVFGWDRQFEIVDTLLKSNLFLLDLGALKGGRSYVLQVTQWTCPYFTGHSGGCGLS